MTATGTNGDSGDALTHLGLGDLVLLVEDEDALVHGHQPHVGLVVALDAQPHGRPRLVDAVVGLRCALHHQLGGK